MSTSQSFSRGVAWMAAGNWTEQAFNLVIFVLLARILGAEAFGLLAMAMAFVILAEFLVRDSLSAYLISSEQLAERDTNTVFWMLIVLGVVLTGLLLSCAGLIAGIYGEPQVKMLVISLSPAVIGVALTAVPVALLRREMRFKALSIRAIVGVVSGGIVGLGLAIGGAGLWALVAQRLTLVTVNVVLAWLAVRWRPSKGIAVTEIGTILRYSRNMIGLRGAEFSIAQVPSVLIGALLGAVSLGHFAIAWRLVDTAAFLIVSPLRMVAMPAFAALRRDDAEGNHMLLDLIRMMGFLSFPAFAGLAALSGPFLVLVFGEDWAPAGPILAALAPFGIVLCLSRLDQAYLLAHDRAGPLALVMWAEVVCAVFAILAFQEYGVVGVTASFVAVFWVMSLFRQMVVSRTSHLSLGALIKPHIAPLAAAMFMFACVALFSRSVDTWPVVPVLLCGIALGVALYSIFVATVLRDRLTLLLSYARMTKHPPQVN